MHLAKELQVDDRITWKASLTQTELLRELQAADVLLLLSKSEAYGIVVAEALSAGTPCIVANTTALREFATEPGCFGVESPSNPKAVAELVLYIHENDIRVGPFSNKIRTWGKVVQNYEAIYQNLLDAPTDTVS
jgi:glycosyltransferase involved in cell wall biosynthesis